MPLGSQGNGRGGRPAVLEGVALDDLKDEGLHAVAIRSRGADDLLDGPPIGRLEASADKRDGASVRVSVAGGTVVMAEGDFHGGLS